MTPTRIETVQLASRQFNSYQDGSKKLNGGCNGLRYVTGTDTHWSSGRTVSDSKPMVDGNGITAKDSLLGQSKQTSCVIEAPRGAF